MNITNKLKAGDHVYECRNGEAVFIEILTDPKVIVRTDNTHYWYWKARIIQITSIIQSVSFKPGTIIDYGIDEENVGYGPLLYRQNIYKVGNAERILPPFDTGRDIKVEKETDE